MSVLIWILIGIGGFYLLMVITGMFLPRYVHVERSIEINARAQEIYPYMESLRKWQEWSPWVEKDPNMQHTFEGPETGAGAIHRWKGNKNVGFGYLVITAAYPFEKIEYDLFFGRSRKPGKVSWHLKEMGDHTIATWIMHNDMGYNFPGRIFGVFFDRMLGPDYEKGLANLKKLVEKK